MKVVRRGPAAAAGLRAGDVIVAIGGSPVRDSAGLSALVQGGVVTEPTEVRIDRGGRSLTLDASLRLRPAEP